MWDRDILKCARCAHIFEATPSPKSARCPKCSAPDAAWLAMSERYGLQLTDAEIEAGRHRHLIGGIWEEGPYVADLLVKLGGLKPTHTVLDFGCGCLRVGVPLAQYVGAERYFGLDLNASLIKAASVEARSAGVGSLQLAVSTDFQIPAHWPEHFDFIYAGSVLTHLRLHGVLKCLASIASRLDTGVFYATILEAGENFLDSKEQPYGVVSHFDVDPFHQTLEQVQWMASQVGLKASMVTEWADELGPPAHLERAPMGAQKLLRIVRA